MDEKEVDASSAPHKRSKSVPAMSPAFLNDTQLQDQQIVGRSRSNTVDSVERLVRTQRRGARLSSGGLLRNQSKKRRNKETLIKSRSVDVIERNERDDSSRKSSNSSVSSEREEERRLSRARKQGFCLPAVNSVLEKLKTMENEKEFSNNIDSDQTNSSGVCSASEETFVGEQQLNLTDNLHDDLKLSEYKTLDDPSHPSKLTDNVEKQEKITEDRTFDFRGSKMNIRRKSLPVDLSEYQIYSNLEDYSGDGEYRTRLMSCSQTDMKFQNNYGIVYKKGCQNKLCRRWQSLPESLYKVNVAAAVTSTYQLVPSSLEERETEVFVEAVELKSSNMQDSRRHQENENFTSESSREKEEGEDDTVANKPILEQRQSSSPEKNLDTKEQMEVTKRSNKIKRSLSLPIKFDIFDGDERQEMETRELKRTKSLTTGESFDEVFPVMLSEKTTKLEPDMKNVDDKHHEKNGKDDNGVVQKKKRRGRGRDRRRAKSLPVSLVLEEIPEESPEQYGCNEYESVEEMAKKHINRAFQELLRKIQNSQRPRNKLKRTRSLSTIKEATASSETLHEVEVESRQQDDNVTLQNGDHAQKHVDITDHEHEPGREEHHEEHEHEEVEVNHEKSDCLEGEEYDDVNLELLQQPSEEELTTEEGLQDKNEKPQLSELQELIHEYNDAEESLIDKEKQEQPVDTTQESAVLNETLNEHVEEEISIMHKAKEELHLDIPQILVSEVEYKESQLFVVNSYDDDAYDDVDGCAEPEGSSEKYVSSQTEDLKSPDDEDIQGTLLEHINNIDFTFDSSINQRSIVNFSCMERIPEDPDKENAIESPETETEPDCESNEFEFDSTRIMEEQTTLKRAGSMRKCKSIRGKYSSPSRKNSWLNSGESNRDENRVTWSDLPDAAKGRENQVDQEDGFNDQYEPGPRGDFIFTGAEDTYQCISKDTHQDEFEEGPRGEICFTDEHGTPVNLSDQYKSDEFDFEPLESKFDVMVRNAINSYLEPDYTKSESPIHRAVALGNVDHLKQLIDEGANANALDEHGWPPLHVATLFNKIDCAELLLEAGADLQGYTDSLINEYKTLAEQEYNI